MKTTIDIANPLFFQAKNWAHEKKMTMREVFELALRLFFNPVKKTKPFKLKKYHFKGTGLVPDLAGKDWADIKNMIRDRGFDDRY